MTLLLIGKPSEITYWHGEHVLQKEAENMGFHPLKNIYCIGERTCTTTTCRRDKRTSWPRRGSLVLAASTTWCPTLAVCTSSGQSTATQFLLRPGSSPPTEMDRQSRWSPVRGTSSRWRAATRSRPSPASTSLMPSRQYSDERNICVVHNRFLNVNTLLLRL